MDYQTMNDYQKRWSMVRDQVLPDILHICSPKYQDHRGHLLVTYIKEGFQKFGISKDFETEIQSCSKRGTLRGLHYQIRYPQGKLLRVIRGQILDVAVDLRKRSPTFGRWTSNRLSAENPEQLWIPEGFAHGFYVLSAWADVLYKATDRYAPEWEYTLAWDDPDVAIHWDIPDGIPLSMSEKDAHGKRLNELPVFE